MKKSLLSTLLATTFALPILISPVTAHAETGGCLKYGAAGAVAGHFMGKHHVLGAVGGCAVGAYKRHQARKVQAEKAKLYDQEHQAAATARADSNAAKADIKAAQALPSDENSVP